MVTRTGLFRSRTNKVLGGVASGIAYHLNTDPTLIRVLFVIMALFWGGGILLYLILWIALPEADIPQYYHTGQQAATGDNPDVASEQKTYKDYPVSSYGNNSALILGLIFIAVGAAFLLERFIPRIHFGQLWPLILVIAGLVLIITNFTGSKKSDS